PTDTRAEVAGLAASASVLYASDPLHDAGNVDDAQTRQKKGSWSAHEPGRIAHAADGTIWLFTDTLNGPAKLAHVRPDGG
ncbi:hypothetical protein AAHH78_39180, partial [Burkholderia pseudomallei]